MHFKEVLFFKQIILQNSLLGSSHIHLPAELTLRKVLQMPLGFIFYTQHICDI